MKSLNPDHSLYTPREVIISDMTLDSFFNIVYEMAIVLAVVTFAMCFLYLFTGRGEAEA